MGHFCPNVKACGKKIWGWKYPGLGYTFIQVLGQIRGAPSGSNLYWVAISLCRAGKDLAGVEQSCGVQHEFKGGGRGRR